MYKRRFRAYLVSVLSAICVCLLSFVLSCPVVSTVVAKELKSNNELIIHFIDVGQGDATFVELPSGETILIDGGESEYGEKVSDYISDLGYKKIDCVIATHSDSDHVGGLVNVLADFEVKSILRPFVIASNANPKDDLSTMGLTDSQILFDHNIAYTNFINAVYKESYDGNNSKISTLSNKTIADVFMATSEPYFMIEVIYPFAENGYDRFTTPSGRTDGYKLELPADANDLSAIIYIATKKNKVLLMSDASEKIENKLLDLTVVNNYLNDRLKSVDLLKVAHHGSKNANTKAFLELCNPKFSVISVGPENEYEHPNAEVLDRLSAVTSEVLRTDIDGTIVARFLVDGNIEFSTSGRSSVKLIPESILYVFFGLLIVAIVVTSIIYTNKKKKKASSK